MKKDELTALGLNDEQIKAIQKLNGTDIENAKQAAKAEYQPQIDGLTSQLTAAKDGLKKFEGIDVDKMQGEIQKLNKQIADNDAAYKQAMADRDFNDQLSGAITKAGGRNAKAISALLDIETLKKSTNHGKDIVAAIEAVKKDNDYLFTSDQPVKNPVGDTGGDGGNFNPASDAYMAKVRAVMGVPLEKK